MGHIDIFAVLVAALATFLVGGVWYSPVLFGKLWTREAGVAEQAGHPAKVYGLSYLFSVIAAAALAVWLGPDPEVKRATLHGLAAGACLVATSFGINYQFANRSLTLWGIDGAYHTVQFAIIGLVLGLWP